MRTTQAPKNKKNIIIPTVISAIILITAGYAFFAYTQSVWPFTKNSATDTNEKINTEKINNLNKEDPTNTTEKNPENTDSSTDTETTKSNVQVGISSAGVFNGNVEVRAFMSGVIEGDGSCTAIFTKGSERVTASSTAFIDTHTTQCNPIILEQSKLSKGTWSLTVEYTSNGYSGVSAGMEVTL